MPIVVKCPKCPTKLSAPDTAAGKQLRCPKCGALADVPTFVPAEEVPVVDAAPVPTKPKPKPVQAEEVEEERPRKKPRRNEDDEDEDAPPPKKKKRRDDDDYDHDHPRRRQKAGGGKGGMVAVIVIGGLLLLAGVGVGIYFLVGKGSSVKKAPVPPGWEQHKYPDDGFQVYLPKPPQYTNIPVNTFGGLGGGRGRLGGGGFGGMGGFAGGNDLGDADRCAMVSSGNWNDSVHVEVMIIRFRNKLPSSVRDSLRNAPGGQFGGMEMKTVKWLGYDAVEQSHQGGVIRFVYTERHFVMAIINGSNGTRAKPEEEVGFFDNFEIIK
jgi:hypothetical protein